MRIEQAATSGGRLRFVALRLTVASAAAFLLSCAGLKAYLIAAYLRSGIHPLAEAGAGRTFLLGGADVAAALALFPLYFLVHWLGLLSRGALRFGLASFFPWSVHLTATAMLLVNVRITQVFGQPLSFDLLDYVQSLQVTRDSVVASLRLDAAVGLVSSVLLFAAARRIAGRPRCCLPPAPCVVAAIVGGAAAAAVYALASFHSLRGVYTYGLKDNPIVALARSYQAKRGREDFPRERAILAQRLADSGGSRLDLTSAAGISGPARGAPSLAGRAAGMNLVVVLLESSSARSLDSRSSPRLQALRSHALVLDRYFTTAAFTFDAHYSIFYSQPVRGMAFGMREAYGGPPRDPSFVEVFRAHGYRTAIFASSFLRFGDTRWVYSKGFDKVVGAEDLVTVDRPGWSWGAYETETVAAATKWIQANSGAPILLVYNAITPHHPYHAPLRERPFPGASLEANYLNAMFYTDGAVGSLLDFLDASGLRDNTVVLLTSDHGETTELAGGGHGLVFSDAELRVPFLIESARLFPQPMALDVYANHLDIAPSVCALFGFDVEPEWSGRSLLAEEVPRHLLQVGPGVGTYMGLIDEGFAFEWNRNDGRTQAYRVDPAGFTQLAGGEVPPGTVERWTRSVKTFDDKTMLRHLERAAR